MEATLQSPFGQTVLLRRSAIVRSYLDLSKEYNASGADLMVLKEERNGNE
jgi:hypothetical protein